MHSRSALVLLFFFVVVVVYSSTADYDMRIAQKELAATQNFLVNKKKGKVLFDICQKCS